MRRLGPFSFAIAGFSIALLTAAPQTGLTRDGSNWTKTEQGSFTVDPAGQIHIQASGNIRVRGVAGAQVTYQLTRSIRAGREADAEMLLDRFPVTKTQQGRMALFQVAYGPFATNLELGVPRGLESTFLETLGGDIDVSDLKGGLVAEASGGKINVGQVGGSVDVRAAGGTIVLGSIGGNARCLSGGGAISATEIRGDAFLETGGGDILLRKAGGAVRASTGGGGIQVLEAKGTVQANTFGGPIQIGPARGVHCESASGSIVAQFPAGLGILDSFLSTGAGDITVWIPSNLKISIRALSEGGVQSVVSDFPGLRLRSDGALVMAELLINGGGPVLQMSGNGGRIFIRKR
jgi:hypothetical protein